MIGTFRCPRFTIACSDGKIFLYARSPVAPKKTSASEWKLAMNVTPSSSFRVEQQYGWRIEIRVAEEVDGAVHAGQRNGPHVTLETLLHLNSLMKCDCRRSDRVRGGCLRPFASWLPEPNTTYMRVLVRFSKCVRRKSSNPSCVSTAQYHVVWLQRVLQFCDHIEHAFGPFLLSSPLKGG